MRSAERIVVVGSGMAATRLVEELVSQGSNADVEHQITVLGEEDHAPYNRILLSGLLEGTQRADALTLRHPDWYAENGVELRLGARVLGVDREHQDVMLVDGSCVPYDRLVLATGSIPTLPPIRGLVRVDGRLHDRVHAFRSLDDCIRLDAAVPHARRAVVVGGGLLGLQVARALSIRGLETEIVEGGEHVMRGQLTSSAGRLLGQELTRLGTSVYTGSRAIRLEELGNQDESGEAGSLGLRLDTGYTLTTDLVVLTAGGRPSTALARAAGLTTRRGIVVDDRLASVDDPRIHAIGDCAEPEVHGRGVTAGLVPPAWEQARLLAALLCDDSEQGRYLGTRSVARLRATGLDVAVLGDSTAEGDVVEVSNPIVGSHRSLTVRDGVIVAATLVGDLSRIGLITQYYDCGTRLAPHEPGALLMGDQVAAPSKLPDAAEICACAGVSAGAIRACGSLVEVRERTHATTGCGGCAPSVRQLLATRPILTGSTKES